MKGMSGLLGIMLEISSEEQIWYNCSSRYWRGHFFRPSINVKKFNFRGFFPKKLIFMYDDTTIIFIFLWVFPLLGRLFIYLRCTTCDHCPLLWNCCGAVVAAAAAGCLFYVAALLLIAAAAAVGCLANHSAAACTSCSTARAAPSCCRSRAG